MINSLKRFRRVATRYEKLSHNYLAMVTIAAITIWLRAWLSPRRLGCGP